MHFYESSIITTKEGMHLQVYGNDHPLTAIMVKPKYIPTDKIECETLPYRFISGRRMNRLDMWSNKDELNKYIESFKKYYPEYVFTSNFHDRDRLFFAVPIDKIERIYSPKRGILELMKIPIDHLDSHLKLIHQLISFLMISGISIENFGLTYSSLIGNYHSEISDINIVLRGKANFWKLMNFLETAQHPLLRWKTKDEWMDFRKKRNRSNFFSEEEFIKAMSRKKSEGYFGDSLFVIFCAEEEGESWMKWGEEKYLEVAQVIIEGTVSDNYHSVIRPGFYEITDSKILEGYENVPIKKVVFYSRDYAMLAFPGEKIKSCGLLEKVVPINGEHYYRVVVGYFDSYLSDRREKEYIKPIFNTAQISNRLIGEDCALCKESKLKVGEKTDYGAVILCKIGESNEDGWFATLSPKTGGNPQKDFSIQLSPFAHLKNFSQISSYPNLAANYGILFSKICYAVSEIMKRQGLEDNQKIPIGTYGKCKHANEHIHTKIFPWRNNLGQPYIVDSSFEKKEVFKNEKTEENFVKMIPVKKEYIPIEIFDNLAKTFISLLNPKEIDLHIHTTASDGDYSGKEIVDLALKKNMKVIAITDHDTLASLPDALEYAKNKNISIIPGVEISCEDNELGISELHILGLFINPSNKELNFLLERMKQERIIQKKEIINKLSNLGYEINFDELAKEVKGRFGRPHIAKILIKKYPHFKDVQQVFDELLGEGKKAYVKQKHCSIQEAIEAIKKAGGISILAHPAIYIDKLKSVTEKFISLGGRGIEFFYPYDKAYHLSPEFLNESKNYLENIAKEKCLFLTGGSDFHGSGRGTEIGEEGIDEKEFEILKNYILQNI